MKPKLTPELAEETGIHVGDGSMNVYKRNMHYYTVACHKIDDREYMEEFILPLIKKLYGKTPKPRFWSQGTYGFRICSKDIIKFKNEVLGLPLGKKIGVCIPNQILKEEKLVKSFLRGFVDTDGCITCFMANKKTVYPRIQMSNISIKLMNQIYLCLKKMGFRVSKWKIIYREEWNDAVIISINGYEMVRKWKKEIGFSNPKHLKKLEKIGI